MRSSSVEVGLVFYASAFSLLLFTGCSSDDNLAGSGAGEVINGESTVTIGATGVQQIPVNVAAGTIEVTVKYTVNGEEKEVTAPFTQTSAASNSGVVSGYTALYSANPATIDVYSGDLLLAEGLQLSGRNATYSAPLTYGGSTEKAYFYIHWDESNDPNVIVPSTKSTPANPADEQNCGTIIVDVNNALWKQKDNGTSYVYSSNGSATALVVDSIPANVYTLSVNGSSIDTKTQTVIWYLVQRNTTDKRWKVEGVLVDNAKASASVDLSQTTTYATLKDTVLTSVSGPTTGPGTSTGSGSGTGTGSNTGTSTGTPSVNPGATTIFYAGGVMMYDADNDKDYNDLVVDYDVESVFPASEAQSPYVRVVMHLRALSNKSIDKVSIELAGMENYVCPTDDMYITFHGINIDKTPAFSENGAYMIPDFRACELTPGTNGNTNAEVGNLQWILTNGKADWFDVDANGYYNVTQQDFNGKDFATVEIVYYPERTVANVEAEVAKIIDVVSQSFKFDGKDGDYIIAPVGTPHVMEGYTINQAFPLYGTPGEDWWNHSYAERVVDINLGYQK